MNKDDKQMNFIGKAYKNYVNKIKLQNNWEVTLRVMNVNTIGHQESLSKEEFVNKCKTDEEFSKRWGITIETRELSLDEKMEYYFSNICKNKDLEEKSMTHTDEQKMQYLQVLSVGNNIPTKLTTINYNGQIQEIYE